MKTRSLYLLLVLLLAGACAQPAAAQVRANISFGYPSRAYYGPRYYAPRPPVVYAVPPPVVVVPGPYYAPRPVYYAPRPVYYAPRPYYGRGWGHGRGRRW
ncbi:MAG: hypothetical protein M3Y54_12665 [Bacteroidota bacterium]|nr:hypothetical protein [Bacteroidota bacterium]